MPALRCDNRERLPEPGYGGGGVSPTPMSHMSPVSDLRPKVT